MYAVRRWDEEKIIQGLAVAMCLALLGMAVMPVVLHLPKITYIADQTGLSKEHPYLTAFISNAAGGAVGGAVGTAVAYYLVEGAEWGALAGGVVGAIVGAIVGAGISVA